MTKQNFNATGLKYLALVCMLIDHLSAVVLMPYWGIHFAPSQLPLVLSLEGEVRTHALVCLTLRYIGRLAFPIFAFMIAEGMVHTHSRARYLSRLGILAVVSEVPFDLAHSGQLIDTTAQSTIVTLFLGALAILIVATLPRHYKGVSLNIASLCVMLIVMALAQRLHIDYGAMGVAMVVALYLLRENRLEACLVGAALAIAETTAVLAFVPLYYYNGARGRGMKYLFYVFYPTHLALLYLLRYWMMGV